MLSDRREEFTRLRSQAVNRIHRQVVSAHAKKDAREPSRLYDYGHDRLTANRN